MTIWYRRKHRNPLTCARKEPENFTSCKANYNFPDIIKQRSPISNFTEIHPVGTALTNVDRRTDRRKVMTNITSAFRDYSHEPNNEVFQVTSFVTLEKKLNNQTCYEIAVGKSSSEDVVPCITYSPYTKRFLN
jgi:hypothetical protein